MNMKINFVHKRLKKPNMHIIWNVKASLYKKHFFRLRKKFKKWKIKLKKLKRPTNSLSLEPFVIVIPSFIILISSQLLKKYTTIKLRLLID